MKKLKKLWPILAVVAVTAIMIPSLAFARTRGGSSHSCGEGMGHLGEVYETLTEEQKDAIRELHTEHQKEMIDLRADVEKKQIELQELIHDEAAESKIFAKIEEIGKIRTDMQKKKVKKMLDIRNLLTDEQKEQLEGMGLHGLMGGPGAHGHQGGHRGPGGPGEPGGHGPIQE